MKKTAKSNIYVNEILLKSLIIRVNNKKANLYDSKHNYRCNQLLRTFLNLIQKSYKDQKITSKKTKLKEHLKSRIIQLSEITQADEKTYNDFAKCIILMIKRILTKPQFSGYSFKDDFYSDASYKILKYIHNFDHTKKSVITGLPVNAFSYVSQIIHNSVIYIINEHKKYNSRLRDQYENYRTIVNISKKTHFNEDPLVEPEKCFRTVHLSTLDDIKSEIKRIDSENFNLNCNISYIISKDLKTNLEHNHISKDAYIELSDLAFGKGILVKFETENV